MGNNFAHCCTTREPVDELKTVVKINTPRINFEAVSPVKEARDLEDFEFDTPFEPSQQMQTEPILSTSGSKAGNNQRLVVSEQQFREEGIKDLTLPPSPKAPKNILVEQAQTYSELLKHLDESSVIQGDITHLRFSEEGPECAAHFIVITEQMLRIYHDKMVYMDTPEQPLVQIPIYAIESVIENFSHQYLDLDEESEFVKNRFAVKLKHEFLFLYL